MTRKGILFVISGPSGVGKGTIRERVLTRMPDVYLSISATTRPPRTGELHGRDYYFLTQEEFDGMLNRNDFLEYAKVYDHYYGTPANFVQKHIQAGEDVLLEIDIQGAMQVKKHFPEGVFIFIQPPSIEILAERLVSRGTDSEESVQCRLSACEWEMAQYIYYDYAVINDELEEAVQRVQAIITAERCRVKNLE